MFRGWLSKPLLSSCKWGSVVGKSCSFLLSWSLPCGGKARRGSLQQALGSPIPNAQRKAGRRVGEELPNSNLASSYQLQSSFSRRWNQRSPGLFVYFSPHFWHKEIKANPLLCPPPPCISSSFPSLSYTAENQEPQSRHGFPGMALP